MFYDFIQLLAKRKNAIVFTAGCLLTAFIFTGCGSGGSSNGDNDETIASAAKSFMAEFPTFDGGGKNVIYAETSIYYDYISKDYAKTIITTLEAKDFSSNCPDSSYCEYLPKCSPVSQNLTGIKSYAYFDGDNPEFSFALQAERKIAYSEFDNIFGSFTKFNDIIALLKYNTNMSAEFDIYRNKLIDSGLFTAADCNNMPDGWHCSKNDGFVYHSVTAGNFNGDTEAILFEKYY